MTDNDPTLHELVTGWDDATLTSEYIMQATVTNLDQLTAETQQALGDFRDAIRGEVTRRDLWPAIGFARTGAYLVAWADATAHAIRRGRTDKNPTRMELARTRR